MVNGTKPIFCYPGSPKKNTYVCRGYPSNDMAPERGPSKRFQRRRRRRKEEEEEEGFAEFVFISISRFLSAPLLKVNNLSWFNGKPISEEAEGLQSVPFH